LKEEGSKGKGLYLLYHKAERESRVTAVLIPDLGARFRRIVSVGN
jgi:hypothetical protein